MSLYTEFRSYGLSALRVLRVLGYFRPNHFGPGLLGPNHFYMGSSGLHSLAIILISAIVSKTRGLSTSTAITSKECYTLNDCEGVSKFKGMPGISQSNKVPGSITNKSTDTGYNNNKECM